MYHFLNGRFVFALLFVMSFGWVIGTVDAQEQEPQPFMPALLEDGVSIQDEFEGTLTARMYGFNGSQGDEINVQMSGDLDSYLVLFGSAGEFLAYNDDADEAFGDAAIDAFTLPYSGRYYVLATSYNYVDGVMAASMSLDEPQEYEIALTGNTSPLDMEGFEPDGAQLTAFSVVPGEDAVGELTAESPIGYFSFEAAAGDTVSVSIESDDVMYPVLHLFAPDGSRVGLSNPLSDPLENVDLTMDGEYLVMTMDAFFVDRLLPNAGDYGLGNVTVSTSAH